MAIRVSYRSMILLVSNCRSPPVLNSLRSHPKGRTIPSMLSRLMLVTMASALALMVFISGSSVSQMFMPSGAVNVGKPARSRSMPMPSISWMRRLKYQSRYALRRMLRPSGFPLRLFVRKNNSFSAGIVMSS